MLAECLLPLCSQPAHGYEASAQTPRSCIEGKEDGWNEIIEMGSRGEEIWKED